MKPSEQLVLFTLGYEGKQQSQVLDILMTQHIQVLVDVRGVAWSRKRGFSKTQLAASLEEVGIEYRHIRELGSPREARQDYRQTGDFDTFAARYLKHVKNRPQPLLQLASQVCDSPTCLLCYEDSANQCHRSLLADEIVRAEKRTLEVVHL